MARGKEQDEDGGERKLLGHILMDMGLLEQAQLDQAVQQQKEQGGALGQIFMELGMITD